MQIMHAFGFSCVNTRNMRTKLYRFVICIFKLMYEINVTTVAQGLYLLIECNILTKS